MLIRAAYFIKGLNPVKGLCKPTEVKNWYTVVNEVKAQISATTALLF
jgi:hypothetical protein